MPNLKKCIIMQLLLLFAFSSNSYGFNNFNFDGAIEEEKENTIEEENRIIELRIIENRIIELRVYQR